MSLPFTAVIHDLVASDVCYSNICTYCGKDYTLWANYGI